MQDLSWILTQRMSQHLTHMDRWFDKAAAHAEAKKFDVNTLLSFRLAPDQFALVRQIGAACDNAKLATARLSGKTAPRHPDDQTTFDQCRTRVAEVMAFIQSTTRDDFANAATVEATFPWYPGKTLAAEPYLLQYALPNFYFHYTTTYAILRNNGVDVGKGDYLGELPFREV